VLSAWTPAVSLWVGCSFFLFASQVTCTTGCPLPYGDTFNLQDFLHTLAAVLAFAAACWAMLQASFAKGHRLLAVFSGVTGIIVAVVAGTGGLLSLFRWQAEFGSRLEFVATTIAIFWLVIFGAVLAARAVRPDPVESALAEAPADLQPQEDLLVTS
jgi:heme A synthase